MGGGGGADCGVTLCVGCVQEYDKTQFLSHILYECVSQEKLDMLEVYVAMHQVSGTVCVVQSLSHTGVCVSWCFCLRQLVFVSAGVCVSWCFCLCQLVFVFVSAGVCVGWCLSQLVFVSAGICVSWCLCQLVFVSTGVCVCVTGS